MGDLDAKKHVLAALSAALLPLIRLALRNGLQARDLSGLIKEVFVEAAGHELDSAGTRISNARVSAMSGLDRKDVAQIRRQGSALGKTNFVAVQNKVHRITRILAMWHRSEQYIDQNGQPLELYRHRGSPNLTDLVGTFSGDIPDSSIIDEMVRVNAVERTSSGKFRVLREAYIPLPIVEDPEFLVRAGGVLNDVGRTLVSNLYRDKNDKGLFEQRVTESIDESHVAEFKMLSHTLCESNLKALNTWLRSCQDNENKEKTPKSAKNAVRVGVGIYFIQGDSND